MQIRGAAAMVQVVERLLQHGNLTKLLTSAQCVAEFPWLWAVGGGTNGSSQISNRNGTRGPHLTQAKSQSPALGPQGHGQLLDLVWAIVPLPSAHPPALRGKPSLTSSPG